MGKDLGDAANEFCCRAWLGRLRLMAKSYLGIDMVLVILPVFILVGGHGFRSNRGGGTLVIAHS